MSHKTEVAVNIDNREALIAALEEMGYGVELNKKIGSNYGFTIDADIAVVKGSNRLTIGFKQKDDGTFKLEADFYGTGISQKTFQDQVNTLHAKHKTSGWLAENRYQVSYETDEDGDLVVVGTKWN